MKFEPCKDKIEPQHHHITLTTDWSTGWCPDPIVSTLFEWWSIKFVIWGAGQVTHRPGRAWSLFAAFFCDYMLANNKSTAGASFRGQNVQGKMAVNT